MAERPILFSDAMVRAILAGAKTQTRRVVQSPAKVIKRRAAGDPWYGDCPYGQPGDRLWVREAWSTEGRPVEEVRAEHEDAMSDGTGVYYRATEVYPSSLLWRPSIYMPRWASRITLEVVDVRVERVQSISEEDARAEGVSPEPSAALADSPVGLTAREAFRELWDSINGERPGCSWADDPWVWVVNFRRVEVRR